MSNTTVQLADKQRGSLAESRVVYVVLYVNDIAVARDFYEKTLGLKVLEADRNSAKYDTGQTILCLHRASDYGITFAAPDKSADITFLVDNLEKVRDALAERGVKFSDTLRYEIGATVDFYDPDGHWLSLYEPSAAAMTWPSGRKLKAILNTSGKDLVDDRPSERSGISSTLSGAGLEGRQLVYLFVFVPDPDAAFEFYSGVLGLRDIERRPCRRGTTENERGVVKYDAGGLMLTTHHREDASPSKGQVTNSGPEDAPATQRKAVAVVFHVHNLDHALQALSQKSVKTKAVGCAGDGRIAKLEDPFGRVLYLFEPSPETLKGRAGERLEQIIAAPL